MIQRKIGDWTYAVKPVEPVPAGFADAAGGVKWLLDQAEAHGLTTLLAHADDGVIWGRVENGKLALSREVFEDVSPQLRSTTLQELRLFGKQAELMVWRTGEREWRARLIDDRGKDITGWSFLEEHLQWGTRREDTKGGFTLVREGQQGMRHAVPLAVPREVFEPEGERHPLRLCVRHYLAQDEDGALYVCQGRLVDLFIEGDKEACDE
jgi:CRISPR-associated protein (TIGR03984 family)